MPRRMSFQRYMCFDLNFLNGSFTLLYNILRQKCLVPFFIDCTYVLLSKHLLRKLIFKFLIEGITDSFFVLFASFLKLFADDFAVNITCHPIQVNLLDSDPNGIPLDCSETLPQTSLLWKIFWKELHFLSHMPLRSETLFPGGSFLVSTSSGRFIRARVCSCFSGRK